MKFRKSFIFGIVRLIFFAVCSLAQYQPVQSVNVNEFAAGVDSFQRHDYKTAVVHFETAVRRNPRDYNAIYYMALSYSQLGLKNKAQEAYANLVKNFSGTEAALNAERALAYANPSYLRQLKPQNVEIYGRPKTNPQYGTAAPDSRLNNYGVEDDAASLPNQAKIYFENIGKNLLIDASINGRPLKMIFDSGAEACAFGKNHLTELGIQMPASEPSGYSIGVGNGGPQRTWRLRVNLKVGNIERKNFPIDVQELMSAPPLLGQTFFKAFNYEIDNGAKSISFVKKGSLANSGNSLQKDQNVIPFTREGNELVVNVELNGRNVPMYLDTGAEGVVFFADQARQFGLTVPEDAHKGISAGIAGQTTFRSFTVSRMRCGPIIKNDVTVAVLDADSPQSGAQAGQGKTPGQSLGHPLLGQEFFGDTRLTVDNQAGVVRMRR